jgi:hypothetical protein
MGNRLCSCPCERRLAPESCLLLTADRRHQQLAFTISPLPPIHPQGHIVTSQVPGSTRPSPLRGPLDQSTSHRVLMDVVDTAASGLAGPDVPVLPASLQPEAMFATADGPRNQQAIEHSRARLANIPYSSPCNGLLDRLEDVREAVLFLLHPEEQMNVLGHDHTFPQPELVHHPSPINRLHEPLACAVVVQQLETPVAREGQLVQAVPDVAILPYLANPARLATP